MNDDLNRIKQRKPRSRQICTNSVSVCLSVFTSVSHLHYHSLYKYQSPLLAFKSPKHKLQHYSLTILLDPTWIKGSRGMESGCGSMEKCEGEQQPHVLAVDDSLIDRLLIERLLKNSSCRVTTAENGLRALEYLGLGDDQHSNGNVSKVNMIITDYCMPGMTGYELLKKIKESSATREVPVVIMSSENVPTRINQCLQEGAQMFMLKPVKLADVKKLRGQLMNSRSR